MSAITLDIADGGELVEDNEGYKAVRVAKVTGLRDGAPSEKQFLALNHAGMPRRGDAHPTIPLLTCSYRRATNITANDLEVILEYRLIIIEPGENDPSIVAPPSIEVGGTLQNVTTQRDLNGNPIHVSHTYIDESDGISSVPRYVRKVVDMEFTLPMLVTRYTRLERKNPRDKAKVYLGRVNSRPVFGDPPHYWLCTNLGGTSSDGGASYQVNYEFTYNPDTWDGEAVFIDNELNGPPSGLVSGTITAEREDYEKLFTDPPGVPQGIGIVTGIRLLKEADFNQLDLKLVRGGT